MRGKTASSTKVHRLPLVIHNLQFSSSCFPRLWGTRVSPGLNQRQLQPSGTLPVNSSQFEKQFYCHVHYVVKRYSTAVAGIWIFLFSPFVQHSDYGKHATSLVSLQKPFPSYPQTISKKMAFQIIRFTGA